MELPSIVPLNKEQMLYLEQFCHKHGVKHYDVKIELIDHLASAIEERRSKDANLTFEQALLDAHKAFGPTGFRKMVSQKELQAERNANRLFWKSFKGYFKIPQILLTLLLVLLFASLYHLQGQDGVWLYKCLAIITFIIWAIGIIGAYRSHKQTKKAKQTLLLTQYMPWHYVIIITPNMMAGQPFTSILQDSEKAITNWLQYGIWSLFLIIALLATLASINAMTQLQLQARKRYPEVFY